MDKLIYLRDIPTYIGSDTGEREPVKIEFDIASDMSITEFKNCCIRLAHALGYSVNNIKTTFGEIEDSDAIKKLLLD